MRLTIVIKLKKGKVLNITQDVFTKSLKMSGKEKENFVLKGVILLSQNMIKFTLMERIGMRN